MHDDQRGSMLVEALLNDRQLEIVDKGQKYLYGRCPNCGENELYISKENPWQLRCNRLNNCGYEESTRSRYRDLFEEFSKRVPATHDNPNATADAYLRENRGFDISRIKGAYFQTLARLKPKGDRKAAAIACETVRFPLWDGHYWERVLDESKVLAIRKKANFSCQISYKGRGWLPPGVAIENGRRTFIVEGIFHAIAFAHAGHKAVAAFSCNNLPRDIIEAHKDNDIEWVLAFDDDKAGRDMMRKYARELCEQGIAFEIALTGSKQDWDDIYRAGGLTEKFIEGCIWRGRLFTAENVTQKAFVQFSNRRSHYFLIDFNDRLFSVSINAEKLSKQLGEAQLTYPDSLDAFKQSVNIEAISNFLPEFVYAEVDNILREQRYVFRVTYCNGNPPDVISLDGTQIDTPTSFHKAMLTSSLGGTFDGTAKDMKILRDRWLNRRIKVVSSIPFIGYDPKTESYVYQSFAFHKGRELKLNEQGYFDAAGHGVKTSFRGFAIRRGNQHSADWLPDFTRVYHWQGLTALAFWLGSLFAQQIRREHQSFPFLELTGEPGAGKSTLIELLWRLCGRDFYEGFDPTKSSPAGRRRTFAQVSNLPLVLIESDRSGEAASSKLKTFDFDELKPLYNGRAVGTLGVANRGNDTEDPLFQGSIVIAQNAEVEGSEALLQRIVHCHCTREHFTPETLALAPKFSGMGVDELAGFLSAALAKEDVILGTYLKAQPAYIERFLRRGDLSEKSIRLVKNHSQVMGCARALQLVFPTLTDDMLGKLEEYIYSRAVARLRRLTADHPVVQRFWELFEYLNWQRDPDAYGDALREVLNHAHNSSEIAINLNHLQEQARNHGQECLDVQQLKAHLPHSRRFPFVEIGRRKSKVLGKTMFCWVFRRENS